MSVHDVPRGRWVQVLEQFSRAHRGWRTRVTRVGPGPALVSSTDWSPLESITTEATGSHINAVVVHLRGEPPVSIGAPRALAIDRRENGADSALELDAAGGEFVRLMFRATARPEELDGLAPAEIEESWRR